MNKDIHSGSEEFETFGDLYSLYKEIGGVETTDEYFKECVEKIDAFAEKHKTVLGRELALAIMGVILEESKEQRYARLITFLGYEAIKDRKVSHELARQAILCESRWIKEDDK
jgi:hypothetical protein